MNHRVWPIILVLLLPACAMKQKQVLQEVDNPASINCATAEGDLRLLQNEKANVAERIAEGITMIAPAGIVVGLLSGTEEVKYKVATDQYNDMIDARIDAIKERCGL